MIFHLDEELAKGQNINEVKNIPTRYLDHLDSALTENETSILLSKKNDNYLQIPNDQAILSDSNEDNMVEYKRSQDKERVRRRSSLIAKFSAASPPFTSRLSILNNGSSIPKGELFGDKMSGTHYYNTLQEEGQNVQFIDKIPDQHDLGTTRTLYDFKPVRVLGKGAYGKVILVKDKYTSKLYAMKQLRKAEILINDTSNNNQEQKENVENTGENEENTILAKRIERTFAERTILSELEHPNIVKLFYSFRDDSKLYLLLQYIPGGELFYHLKEQGTLDEDTVAFYAAEISCALKFLHEKGIVYRDLKPENCLLNEKGHLVLTDFGLSKKSLSESRTPSAVDLKAKLISNEDYSIVSEEEDVVALHSIIGTPEYCAPEILMGQPYTQNCDWYSLGCLIYDMLVGKPPFTGNNHKVILNKIQKEKVGPKIPYYLSDGMKDMLGALLKKDNSKRWNVDKYWKEEKKRDLSNRGKNNNKKKKNSERASIFQAHFIFRKINWEELEKGNLQNTIGPILPVITDWELAENFDSEFTNMEYSFDDHAININDIDERDNFITNGNTHSSSKNIDIRVGSGTTLSNFNGSSTTLNMDIMNGTNAFSRNGSNNNTDRNTGDMFKGFSYSANASYLERYF
ncbi:hypothetical protein TBLA_0I01800 [Henningerozyma blattae CBS 6284]|uniref:Protein kinase domain-containing protein n=1 Tax=Henningerozyma blattae (strain ATCC 34711 / CBS 6284 / DSM 70876 / NBRC 10599 / NRRL Y-10934 / UCD 77-7) TaxID=1071380 RepID=I2H8Y6_HENB6|nr:hypothetical protein TBLA_0I01800 [Tetrapisispora blattae CBS 6284]CCH62838.1 hypothetical protein TBLA_0I01800 [Tetrapisispora blattae CBS 6284]